MRQTLKRFGERALVGSGACRAYRYLNRQSVILTYHNVVPTGSPQRGDSGLHIPVDVFKRQIDRLMETHDIVPLRALLTAPHSSRTNFAAISFDDAYRGAIRLGLEELAAREIHATVFVAPGLLGDISPWWDQLAEESGQLNEGVRDAVLADCLGLHDRALEWAKDRGREAKRLPSYARTVTETELLEAEARAGVQLEAHTWAHTNLARLDGSEINQEFARTVKWFEQRVSDPQPLLAYPYGHLTQNAEALAKEFFAGALRIGGGTFRAGSIENLYRVPRVNVDAKLTTDGFELLCSGLT